MKLLRTHADKVMFLTLWGILLLALGLWKFRPRVTASEPSISEIKVSNELNPFFSRVRLRSIAPTYFTLQVEVRKEYTARLGGDAKSVILGYQFSKDQKELYKGHLSLNIPADSRDLEVTLPNPQGVHARQIELFLAR